MNDIAEKHLAKAKEYIAKGDEFYREAADKIIAAMEADPTLSYREIDRQFGYAGDGKWSKNLVTWRTSAVDTPQSPWSHDTGRRQIDMAKQVLRQAEPETIADFYDDREIKTNIAAAARVHEFRHEARTGIPARNAPTSPSFISLVLKINGWLDELIGMVERGEAVIPDEFSTQSIGDMGVKAMRLKELVDESRESEGVLTHD